jgi:hypothetical protein
MSEVERIRFNIEVQVCGHFLFFIFFLSDLQKLKQRIKKSVGLRKEYVE